MAKTIAVMVDQAGETCNLYEPGKIMIYERQAGRWNLLKEQPFQLTQGGLGQMRKQLAELVEVLGCCKIFVSKTLTGLPYFELEKAHCSIWEFEGKPLTFLDYVIEKEEEAQLEQRQKIVAVPKPVEIEPGIFKISIKDIQEQDSAITSKQVLQGFLRKGSFYSLTIHCNHVPPWLDGELALQGLASEKVRLGDHDLQLTVTKPCCR